MEISLDFSELRALLDEEGVSAPVGVDAAHFPRFNDAEKHKTLQIEQADISGRDSANATALVRVLANPTAVIHAVRIEENKPDEHIWFFYTPDQIVQLQLAGDKRYQLTSFSDEQAIWDHILQLLPLVPVHPDLAYRIIVDEEEFQDLRDLASEWEEVPSLETLEADGLDLVAAEDLFDSAVEPRWRGIIDLMRVDSRDIVATQTVRALQGQEAAWLARPYPADDSKVLIETAQPRELQEALASSWRLVTSP